MIEGMYHSIKHESNLRNLMKDRAWVSSEWPAQ